MTNQSSLNDFNAQKKLPLVLSDEHREYLYRTSNEYKQEQDFKRLIAEKLEEERREKENFKKSTLKTTYIRIGSHNNG